ncbi:MAG: DeoR/GlpR transcriptional regulator [Actinobacteria bacterium]|nr:DeoR/GlpR transcriptional regulator [Actinomycetota bacterium]
MLPQQRQALILERIRDSGAVRVSDLAREFDVSEMTVRRDLDLLEERGLLEKVHGGATLLDAGTAFEPSFASKATRNTAEKLHIGRAAAALVSPGQAVALSAGTTTFQVARFLRDVPGLTVVTNSVQVAEELHHNRTGDQTVILTGGVRTPSDALVGPFTVAALRHIHVDIVFLGVHGMDLDAGFTTPNMLEAEANRALIRAGRRLAVVADHSKWGVVGIATMAAIEDAAVLVTDRGLSQDALGPLRERIDDVIVTDPTTLATEVS